MDQWDVDSKNTKNVLDFSIYLIVQNLFPVIWDVWYTAAELFGCGIHGAPGPMLVLLRFSYIAFQGLDCNTCVVFPQLLVLDAVKTALSFEGYGNRSKTCSKTSSECFFGLNGNKLDFGRAR